MVSLVPIATSKPINQLEEDRDGCIWQGRAALHQPGFHFIPSRDIQPWQEKEEDKNGI